MKARGAMQILIVGAGFSGSVVARELARTGRCGITVIDRRDHIAGNAFDPIHPVTKCRYHEYGPHSHPSTHVCALAGPPGPLDPALQPLAVGRLAPAVPVAVPGHRWPVQELAIEAVDAVKLQRVAFETLEVTRRSDWHSQPLTAKQSFLLPI